MEVCTNHFESLMKVNMEVRPKVTNTGVQIGLGLPYPQGEVEWNEVEGEVYKLIGKAPHVDGITAELLKYGANTVLEWMLWICNRAWQ